MTEYDSPPQKIGWHLSARLSASLAVVVLMLLTALVFFFFGEHAQSLRQPGLTKISGQSTAAVIVMPEVNEPPAAVINALGPETIANVAQAVSPSVVNIDVFNHVTNSGSADPEMEFFFNGNRIAPFQGALFLPQLQKSGTGSGIIIRPDGYILTNYHVVKGADRMTVTLSDHRSFAGKLVGGDSLSDIAVVKIPVADLPVARLGNSRQLRPGEWAVAIGSPLGLDQTVTLGIISAIGRTVADINSEISFIQTDAAINPGNSGGPLLNLQGEVIGINSFTRSDAQKIGFATPIDTAKQVAQELIAQGKIDRAWVGLKLATLTKELRQRLHLNDNRTGAIVVSVVEGGPAAKAGLLKGDIIQKINLSPVSSVKDVQKLVSGHQPDQSLSFEVLRDGQSMNLNVVISDMPEDLE